MLASIALIELLPKMVWSESIFGMSAMLLWWWADNRPKTGNKVSDINVKQLFIDANAKNSKSNKKVDNICSTMPLGCEVGIVTS